MAEAELSGGQRFSAGEKLDQRGFSSAIYPDQGDAVASLNHEADIAENFLGCSVFLIRLGHSLELGDDSSARFRLRK